MILLLSINNSNLQSEIAHHQVKFSPRRVHIKCRAEMDGQTETYIILRVGAHFHANLLGMCKFPALEHLSAGRRIERRRLTYSRSPSALYKNKYFPLPRIVFASLIIIYRCLRAAKKRRAAGDRGKKIAFRPPLEENSTIYSSGRRCCRTDVAYKMVIANSRV
jgi:hypothetical protein